MSSVQCHFCSKTNPADAKFCKSCLGQLNLAPCPHCDGVNEVTALVCHACKGDLAETVGERASGGSEQGRTEPARTEIDTRSQSTTRSTASGALVGSSPNDRVSTEDAAARKFECVGDTATE